MRYAQPSSWRRASSHAEVVAHLVQHRHPHLRRELVDVARALATAGPEDRDAVGRDAAVAERSARGERHALVEPEQRAAGADASPAARRVGQSSTITATFSSSAASSSGISSSASATMRSNSRARDVDHGREQYPRTREIPLAIARARRYDAEAGEHRSGAGSERPGSTSRRRKPEGTSGTGSARKTDRSGIRCGERAERDHPREEREPEADTEAEHLGQPWGEGSEEVGRNGPEEIRAATQRRLLGAFCCSGCSGCGAVDRSADGVGVSVVPERYGADGGRAPRRSRPHAARRGHRAAPRRWRSSPARARARPACSPAASRGSRARA